MAKLESFFPNEWFYPFLDYDNTPARALLNHKSKTFDFNVEGFGNFSLELSDFMKTFDLSERKQAIIVMTRQALHATSLNRLRNYEETTLSILDGIHGFWNNSKLEIDKNSPFAIQLKVPQNAVFTNRFVGESLGEVNANGEWNINQTRQKAFLFVNRYEPSYIKDIQTRIKLPL